mgnify:CR=1 FL=1|tara:strand:+ start:515 stop:811 length:297 start_codon:yes stop_codon:yes gene_type:complete
MSELTRTLVLKYPYKKTFRQGNEEREEIVSELKFRRLSAGDLRAIGGIKSEIEQGLKLLARSCGLTDSEFDKIDVEDMEAAGKLIEDFLPASLKTGNN